MWNGFSVFKLANNMQPKLENETTDCMNNEDGLFHNPVFFCEINHFNFHYRQVSFIRESCTSCKLWWKIHLNSMKLFHFNSSNHRLPSILYKLNTIKQKLKFICYSCFDQSWSGLEYIQLNLKAQFCLNSTNIEMQSLFFLRERWLCIFKTTTVWLTVRSQWL